MTEIDQYKDFIKAMLKVVMPFIRDSFNSRAYHVEEKKDKSPVTEIDRKAEMMLREMINKNFPSHAILGEGKTERCCDLGDREIRKQQDILCCCNFRFQDKCLD